jgi:TonB-linked SusC/RagA family outer membrane protein
MHSTFLRRVTVSVILALGATASGLAAQQPVGIITGRVTTSTPARTPLEAARLVVVGTNLTALSGREGTYTLRNVPVGTVQVRIALLGHGTKTATATVTEGATTTLDFQLDVVPFSLEEITITSAGEARKAEVGNTINTIQANTLVEAAPVSSVSQIITARAPGVTVLPSSGTTGVGSRIRIRGQNSVSLSNEPLFIVDGVRIESSNGSLSVGLGGQNPSRLNDINPEDIAEVQILKGPSASAVYGTGGSNGVVLITTKRGVAGRPRWNFYTEQGVIKDKNPYPDNVWGGLSNGTSRCRLEDQANGLCTVEQISRFNPMLDSEQSPLSNGRRQQWGGSVSGGSDAARYFISGEWESERGVLNMPKMEAERLLTESARTELRPEEQNPNTLNKWSIRANTDFNLSPTARGGVKLGYVTSELYLPQNDNNVNGIHSSGLNGDGRGDSDVSSAWGFFRPGEVFQRSTLQTIWRLTAQASGQYTPTTWLTARAALGLDQTQRQDQQLQRLNEGPNFSTQRSGQAAENRRTINNWTVDASATATFDLTDRLSSRTTAGAQYYEYGFRGTNAFGEQLPGGFTTVTAGAVKDASETNTVTKTAGAFLEEVIGFNERLFVTGAVRIDRNSSTGLEAKAIVYPKAAVSWVTPVAGSFMNSLRLRGSWGTAGQQPVGPTALETYSSVTTAINGGTAPAAALNNLGDPTLKAERSQEFEGGADLTFWDNRLGLELTGYFKETKDALILVPTPLSAGNPAGQFRNVGTTRNQGFEMILNAQAVRSESVTLDFTLTGSLLKSEMHDLGGQPPINVNGANQQIREGYSLGGYWARPYTYNDANGDGIIAGSEITTGDSVAFVAPFLPTREAGLTISLGLFKSKVMISSTLDYRGGNSLWNLQEDFRCRSSQNCDALYDINAPLEDQARIAALRFQGANNTTAGFIEKADYMKWRELSVVFNAPQSWASAIGAERLSIGFAGRNLATVTGYSGPDPEVNGQGEGNFAQRDFLSLPPLRSLAFRLNVTF